MYTVADLEGGSRPPSPIRKTIKEKREKERTIEKKREEKRKTRKDGIKK